MLLAESTIAQISRKEFYAKPKIYQIMQIDSICEKDSIVIYIIIAQNQNQLYKITSLPNVKFCSMNNIHIGNCYMFSLESSLGDSPLHRKGMRYKGFDIDVAVQPNMIRDLFVAKSLRGLHVDKSKFSNCR